jgi:hypothetical protein
MMGETPGELMGRMEANTGAAAGGAMMLQASLIGNLERVEAEKAAKDLEALGPKIEDLRSKGEWVVVVTVMDAPYATDILSFVYKEQSQVNTFKFIYILSGKTAEEALTAKYDYMTEVLPGRRLVEQRSSPLRPYGRAKQDITPEMRAQARLEVLRGAAGNYMDEGGRIMQVSLASEKLNLYLYGKSGEFLQTKLTPPGEQTGGIEFQYLDPETQQVYESRLFLVNGQMFEMTRRVGASDIEFPKRHTWTRQR